MLLVMYFHNSVGMTNYNVKSLAVDVHGLAASNVNTEKGTMSNVQVHNKKTRGRKTMIAMKEATLMKVAKQLLTAIEKGSDKLVGTTVNVTPKQYDEIVFNRVAYKKLFAMSDFTKVTGFKVTSVEGLTREMPLFGTKVLVKIKKVK